MNTEICLVTGGSKGVGRGVALELARQGYTVYITGRKIKSLSEVAQEAKSSSSVGKIIAIQCDHSRDNEVDELFRTIEQQSNDRLDLLVNNVFSAADFLLDNSEKNFWDLPTNAWDEINHVGLRNHYRCSVLASRIMVKRRRGIIINISSMGGKVYLINPVYGCGKCALDRMASDCAVDLRKYNVAFLSLWPCAVKKEDYLTNRSHDSDLNNTKEAIYFFDNGESPQFIGKAVASLLHDKKVISKSGRAMFVADLAKEYGFSDNGRVPADFRCVKDMVAASGYTMLSRFIPSFLKLPFWLLEIIINMLAPEKKETSYA